MKKYIFGLCFLLAVSSASFAMDKEGKIIMPAADVLYNRLIEKKFKCFMEKTRIVDKLANKVLSPLHVADVVTFAIFDYLDECEKSMSTAMFRRAASKILERQTELLEVLLQDASAIVIRAKL